MHLLVADKLTCPRCGPAFPLILLAHDVRERQVLEGSLGCPNCRDRYPIERGCADLRPEPRSPSAPTAGFEAPSDQETMEVAAMLGAASEGARPLLLGKAARYAPALSGLLPGVEWIAGSEEVPEWGERAGIDRMNFGVVLPFADRAVPGVVLQAGERDGWLSEAMRIVATGARLVVLEGGDRERSTLLARGFTVSEPAPGRLVARR